MHIKIKKRNVAIVLTSIQDECILLVQATRATPTRRNKMTNKQTQLKNRLELQTTEELQSGLEKAWSKLANIEKEILEAKDSRWVESMEVWASNTVERIEIIQSIIESRKEVKTAVEVDETPVFKAGQLFRMEKLSGGIGAREAKIIEVKNGHAIVQVGNTSYKAEIKGDYLIYPWNMRAYCNTRITDLIK